MRLAILGLYPPDPNHIAGGVETVTYLLAHTLSSFPAMDVHVVTLRPGISGPRSFDHGDVHVHLFPTPPKTRLLWHRPSVRLMHGALAAIKPDVVHGHGSTLYAAAAIESPYPHVVTVHGIVAREAPTIWEWRARLSIEVDRWFERWTLPKARDIIAISPYVLEAYPWLRARVHHIENPVDPRYFDVEASEVERGNVLCVARVIPRKGIHHLIRAFAQVARDFPHARLSIAGEADPFPKYTALCLDEARKGKVEDKVHFLGPMSPEELVTAYARAQVVVLASLQETAPVVIAEAMAAGRPVVATAVGGIPYMVREGITGWLVPPQDEDALANALAAALEDPKRCARMGEEARADARARFHPLPLAKKHLDVYDTVMGNTGQRVPA